LDYCFFSDFTLFVYFKTIFDKIKYRIFKKITYWKEKKYEQQKKSNPFYLLKLLK